MLAPTTELDVSTDDPLMKASAHARRPRSHGDGCFVPEDFRHLGAGVVFEAGVLVFHPENIDLGDLVYVGHGAILKGYYRNAMRIGAGTWIGQRCFFHAAGGLTIGRDVGVGPGVQIITSSHDEAGRHVPILHAPLRFDPVHIGDGCDIGVGTVILPGTTLGRGVQVGAGAVLKGDYPDYAVVAGVPGRVLRLRPGDDEESVWPSA
ncbi:MAG: acyltransferase [Myxococcota bacterium]